MNLIFFCIAFLCSLPSLAQKDTRDNYPWITIVEIKDCKSDAFRIKAKVIDLYNCPPCPPGAECKPCIGNHLNLKR